MKPKSVKGIFRVDGVTLVLCKKLVTKELEHWQVDKRQPTLSEYNAEFSARVDDKMKSMKPKKLSQEFDTPEAARDFIDLLKRTTSPEFYRDLQIMINVPKLDKERMIQTHPKTGKTLMCWQRYNANEDYSNFARAAA